jgi:hypothetical protein
MLPFQNTNKVLFCKDEKEKCRRLNKNIRVSTRKLSSVSKDNAEYKQGPGFEPRTPPKKNF